MVLTVIRCGCAIRFNRDRVLLGTVDDVQFARRLLDQLVVLGHVVAFCILNLEVVFLCICAGVFAHQLAGCCRVADACRLAARFVVEGHGLYAGLHCAVVFNCFGIFNRRVDLARCDYQLTGNNFGHHILFSCIYSDFFRCSRDFYIISTGICTFSCCGYIVELQACDFLAIAGPNHLISGNGMLISIVIYFSAVRYQLHRNILRLEHVCRIVPVRCLSGIVQRPRECILGPIQPHVLILEISYLSVNPVLRREVCKAPVNFEIGFCVVTLSNIRIVTIQITIIRDYYIGKVIISNIQRVLIRFERIALVEFIANEVVHRICNNAAYVSLQAIILLIFIALDRHEVVQILYFSTLVQLDREVTLKYRCIVRFIVPLLFRNQPVRHVVCQTANLVFSLDCC